MPSSRTGRAREEARRPRVAGLAAEELPPPPVVGPRRAELDRATGQLHRGSLPDAAMAGPPVAVETQVLLASLSALLASCGEAWLAHWQPQPQRRAFTPYVLGVLSA